RAPGGSPGSENPAQARRQGGPINPDYQARRLALVDLNSESEDESAGPPAGHSAPAAAQAAAHRTAHAFINLVGNIPRMNVARQAELVQRQERLAAYRAAIEARPVVPGG
ncbi:MAG: hypothetical protein K0R66_1632, partial [Gammaproteobacteria bacterium]|nr:hypothetical protein [Gammaproteobacteria bacterium]